MTHAEITFAVIVGVISAGGLVCGSWLSARASDRAAKSAREAIEYQIVLTSKAKIAEFRQAWINSLRNEMARFGALALALDTAKRQEVFETAGKIALLMNREDKRYPHLSDCMRKITAFEKGSSANEFREVCQDILKEEWEVLKKELLELKH